jgi:hypothetical protein
MISPTTDGDTDGTCASLRIAFFSRGFRGFPWCFRGTEFVSVFRGFRGPRTTEQAHANMKPAVGK